MATFPSDPYKSRVVRGVVQQTRRLLDRGQTAVRQLQVVASWSAQILLYPVYALFQTGRSMGKRIERSQQAVRLQELEPQRDDILLTQDGAKLTAETPLQNVLQSLQAFELPADYVICVNEPVTIRAIAALIDNQSLVLVTNYNQVLTIPDPEQQHWLKQRIIYEIAVYNRQQRSRKLPFQRVVQAFQSIQTAIRQLSPATSTQRPESLTTQALPASLMLEEAADVPVKRLLLAVQERLYAADVSGLAVFETSTTLKIAASDTAITTTATKTIAPEPSYALPSQSRTRIQGVASLLSNRKLVLVADSNQVLDVLTAEQHQLLYQRIAWEVGSYRRYMALQQQVRRFAPLPPPIAQSSLVLPPVRAFRRLMAWMQLGAVALATNLFQETAWVTSLLPASDDELTTSAIAEPIPLSNQPLRSVLLNRLLPPIQTIRALLAPRSASNSVPSVVPQANTPPPSIYAAPIQPVAVHSVGELVVVPLNSTAIIELNNGTAYLQPVVTESMVMANAVSTLHPLTWQRQSSGAVQIQTDQTARAAVGDERKPSPDYIDTHVTWVDYEQSWLERVMRWLDHCFLWIETVIINLWKLLRQG